MSSKTVIELGPFTISGNGTVATFDLAGFSRGIVLIDVTDGSSSQDYLFKVVPVEPQSGNPCDPNKSAGGVDGGSWSPPVTSGPMTGYLVLPTLFSTQYALQVNATTMTFTATVVALD